LFVIGTVMNNTGIGMSGWWTDMPNGDGTSYCKATSYTPCDVVHGDVVEHINAATVEVRSNGGAGWPIR
jgi:hypothetical protein